MYTQYGRAYNPSEELPECSGLDCSLVIFVVAATIFSGCISYNQIGGDACTAITLATLTISTITARVISTHCSENKNKKISAENYQENLLGIKEKRDELLPLYGTP